MQITRHHQKKNVPFHRLDPIPIPHIQNRIELDIFKKIKSWLTRIFDAQTFHEPFDHVVPYHRRSDRVSVDRQPNLLPDFVPAKQQKKCQKKGKNKLPIKADGIDVRKSFWLRTGTPCSGSCISRTRPSIWAQSPSPPVQLDAISMSFNRNYATSLPNLTKPNLT